MKHPRTVLVPKPKLSRKAQKALSGCKMDVTFKHGTSKADEDAALDHLNSLISWCEL